MQGRVSSDARSISDKTAAAVNSCRLTRPPPVIALESLWLCTLPRYYCQSIKTKASGIRRRIELYTWERDLRGGNIIDSIRHSSSDQGRLQHDTQESTGRSVCQGFDRSAPPVVTSGVRNPPRCRAPSCRYLCPVLLLGVRVHVCESSQHQGLHQGPLHRAAQQVEGGAAAGKLLRQVPPALALHHDVRPGRTELVSDRSIV